MKLHEQRDHYRHTLIDIENKVIDQLWVLNNKTTVHLDSLFNGDRIDVDHIALKQVNVETDVLPLLRDILRTIGGSLEDGGFVPKRTA